MTAFDVSLERLHPEMLRAEGFMAGWLGKGRGTVARLAAVLALLDWTANRPNNAPPPTVITTQHLCDAWDLWERYYRPHAQAVFDRAGPADGDRQGKHKARAARAAGDRLDPRAWRQGGLARGGAARGAQPARERRRRRRGDPGARAGRRVARSRGRRGGLSAPAAARRAAGRSIQRSTCVGANRAAQIAESPGLPSAAGAVRVETPPSSEGRRGRKPRVESLRRIACGNCGKANRSRLEGRGRGGLAKMIKRLAGARTSRPASSSSIRGHERTWSVRAPR